MRCPRRLALLVWLTIFSLVAAADEMVVKNGQFEAALGDDGRMPDWAWWSRTDQGSAQQENSRAQLQHDGPRDWAFSSATRFEVAPGMDFRATARVRVESGSVTLAVVAYKQGELLSWDIGSGRTGPTRDWVELEAFAQTPVGCDRICVRFVGEGLTAAQIDDVAIGQWDRPKVEKPKVRGYAQERVRERLDRGLVARRTDERTVYLSWRLLESDAADVAFNVYRRSGETEGVKRNDSPLEKTTDFVDLSAPREEVHTYHIRPVVDGEECPASPECQLAATDEAPDYVSIRLDGDHTFQKVGLADLDGDGRLDYVIKQPNANVDPYINYWKPSSETFKLEAYNADGKLLWRHDLGWSIERGIWYSPYIVYDFDGDGRAEVAVKTGQGDPRDAEGRVRSGEEWLTILDGMTGQPRTQVEWPSRDGFEGERGYNYSSRNQLAVAYLDGKTPCLLALRGTYNLMKVVAYQFHDGALEELWRWDNSRAPRSYWGQGAHWTHAADVDGDGRDEVLLGSSVLDDNGVELWTTGLGHPDHFYLGDIDPNHPGLEIYYGMESRQKQRNGMCLVAAADGQILWGHEGYTRHVHGSGLCSDIDARFPGSECYSADTDEEKRFAWARLRTAAGQVVSQENLGGFGPRPVWWDADPQRELLLGGRIQDYGAQGGDGTRIEGSLVAVADLLGDWREEIITSLAGELRIYVTTIPATDRRPCLLQDPIYRIDVAHAAMGYTQVPMLSYDLSTGR